VVGAQEVLLQLPAPRGVPAAVDDLHAGEAAPLGAGGQVVATPERGRQRGAGAGGEEHPAGARGRIGGQRRDDRGHRRRARGGVLGRSALGQPQQPRGDRRGQRRLAPQHRPQRGAQAEDVGARVHRLAAEPLGRHVPAGPDEAGHLHHPARDQDVPGRDVAVDDAGGMGRRQAAGGRGHDVHHLADRTRPRAPLGERQPVQQLHGQVGLALVVADVVDPHDVGVPQPGHLARLGQRPVHTPVAAGAVGQELQGDLATEDGVVGRVDHAHARAARGQASEHDVASDVVSDLG
jgi:hypothetical protein